MAYASTPPALRSIDLFSYRWWVTISAVQAVILLSYIASSLPKWAKWVDGTHVDRLMVAQGVCVALLAGNIGWVLSYHYGKVDEALCWVTAALASYGGDAYLAKKMEQLFGRQPEQAAEASK